MSQIQITIPNEPADTLKSVLLLLKENLDIKNMILLSGENNSLIILRRSKKKVSPLMAELSKIGVGVDFGIIDILPLNASIPEIAVDEKSPEKEDLLNEEEITSHISLEEIKKNISEIATIDLNYLIFIFLAALVAGVGLIKNSSVIIIGSMLLSPLMGPILGVSYGIAIKDTKFVRTGLKGQFYGIILGISIGVILGGLNHLINPNFEFTFEILSRSYPNGFDLIVAICSGIAVGFCMTGSIQSALVGISIAVSLLPPIVNTGLVLSYGLFNQAFGSFILMLSNVLVINICATIVFRIKKIESLAITAHDWVGPEESLSKTKKPEEKPRNLKKRMARIFRRKGETM